MLKYLLILTVLLSLPCLADEPAIYPGSCLLETRCVETSQDFTVAQAQSNCLKIKGQYSKDHCPQTNMLGGCAEKTKSEKNYTTIYYSQSEDFDKQEVQLDCVFRNGMWQEKPSTVAMNEQAVPDEQAQP